jgi:MFS family permease
VIGVAFGLGFMVGPAIGAELGKHGLHYPFMLSAGLSALSIICTWTLLPAGKPPQKGAPEAGALPGGKRPSAFALKTYAEYFRRPGLASLYAQFFLFTFAFSCFTSGFALFAERRFYAERDLTRVDQTCTFHPEMDLDPRTAPLGYVLADGKKVEGWKVVDREHVELPQAVCSATHAEIHVPWGVREVGLLFTFSGLLGIILQGGLIGRLVKRFGEVKLSIAGFVSVIIAYVGLGLTYTLAMLLVIAVFNSFGNGVLRPCVTSRITQCVAPYEQGIALGISGSLSSLAMSLAPPTGGVLLDGGYTIAWAMVPGTVALLGLIATLATRPRGTPESGELSSGA